MPRSPEEIQYRARLTVIRIQPLAYHIFAIIVPNHQSIPIQIAHSLHPRRMGSDVVQSAAAGTLPAAGKTSNNNIVIYGGVDPPLVAPPPYQPGCQMLRLIDGPR